MARLSNAFEKNRQATDSGKSNAKYFHSNMCLSYLHSKQR